MNEAVSIGKQIKDRLEYDKYLKQTADIFDVTLETLTTEIDTVKKEAQEKEKQFIELLGKKVAKAQDEKDKQWVSKIEEIKQTLRRNSEGWAVAVLYTPNAPLPN